MVLVESDYVSCRDAAYSWAAESCMPSLCLPCQSCLTSTPCTPSSSCFSTFSRVWLCATPQTAAHQAPPSLGFSRQEHWRGLPFPSPVHESESEASQSCLTLHDPMDCSPLGSSVHGIFQARGLEWGATASSEAPAAPHFIASQTCWVLFCTPIPPGKLVPVASSGLSPGLCLLKTSLH